MMMQPPSTVVPLPLPMADISTFSTIFNSLHPGEDHTFGPGAVGASTSTRIPPPSGNISNQFGQLTPSNLDPAQFIWAVSSQLPQVEESSPYDERSISTGPSPNVGEKARRRREKGKEVEGSKLVKITWWRPHGAVSAHP
jgi:hypothetical protein